MLLVARLPVWEVRSGVTELDEGRANPLAVFFSLECHSHRWAPTWRRHMRSEGSWLPKQCYTHFLPDLNSHTQWADLTSFISSQWEAGSFLISVLGWIEHIVFGNFSTSPRFSSLTSKMGESELIHMSHHVTPLLPYLPLSELKL